MGLTRGGDGQVELRAQLAAAKLEAERAAQDKPKQEVRPSTPITQITLFQPHPYLLTTPGTPTGYPL